MFFDDFDWFVNMGSCVFLGFGEMCEECVSNDEVYFEWVVFFECRCSLDIFVVSEVELVILVFWDDDVCLDGSF